MRRQKIKYDEFDRGHAWRYVFVLSTSWYLLDYRAGEPVVLRSISPVVRSIAPPAQEAQDLRAATCVASNLKGRKFSEHANFSNSVSSRENDDSGDFISSPQYRADLPVRNERNRRFL